MDEITSSTAIVLSGTGTDGTLGIKEIKTKDGLVLAQTDEESAAYEGMPRSAINTGLVDIVLPPDEMPKRLVQYYTHHNIAFAQKPTTTLDTAQQQFLNNIFAILRTQ